MKLRFFARGDLLVSHPTVKVGVGQPALYVGRKFDAKTGTFPATSTPFECESDSREGLRLLKLLGRDKSLYCADKATADFCGVPFVPVDLKDGEMVPQVASPAKRAKESD